MPRPIRPKGGTRQLIIELLEGAGRPMTWSEIARGVEITAGSKTRNRMINDGQIQSAGSDSSGKQLFVVGANPIGQPNANQTRTIQPTPFRVGATYTRNDIYQIMDVPTDKQRGNWETGYHRWGDDVFLFPTVGSAATGGFDYQNRWEGDAFVWYGKTNSRLSQPLINWMLHEVNRVFIFTRERVRQPFTFEGLGVPISWEDESPVLIRWSIDRLNGSSPTQTSKSAQVFDRQSVLRAVAEYDELGQDDFLKKYGFGLARNYWLVYDGRYYDSKAIIGVAYGFENPEEGSRDARSFSGGASTVQRWLEALGFEVEVSGIIHTPKSNPVYPDDLKVPRTYPEGAQRTVIVNAYERSAKARNACIDHWGLDCSACGFNFGVEFGELGEGFIHVHHLLEVASIGKEYEVDPVNDLRPVCPNCHAMLHTRTPAYSIEELTQLRSKI